MKRPGVLSLLSATVVLGLLVLFLSTAGDSLRSPDRSTVAPFSYWEVHHLSIHDSSSSVRLHRAGEEWRLESAEGAAVDSSRVRALIGRWEGGFRPIRAVNESQPEGELSGTGLETDPTRIQMLDSEGEALLDIELGETLRGGRLYVRVRPGGPVVQGVIPPGPAPSAVPSDWLSQSARPQ